MGVGGPGEAAGAGSRLGSRRIAGTLLGLLLLSGLTGTEEQSGEREPLVGEDGTSAECDRLDTALLLPCASSLLPGQYLCLHTEVDPTTQQLRDCRLINGTGKAPVACQALPGIKCSGTCNETFTRYEDCKWTNGYQFDTALLLSVFLGMFGADRFYLGYPAIGLLKFSTLGFFFIGHLVDIILIASQTVGPADGSYYVINYFGAGLTRIGVNDDTYRREQPDWY